MLTREVIRHAEEAGYRICLVTGNIYGKLGQHLTGSKRKNGYIAISIYIAGLTPQKGYQVNQHQLVAYAKYGEQMFEPGIEVRHLDDVGSNNHPSNIVLGTRLDNIMDMPAEKRSGRCLGKPSSKRKVPSEAVQEIREIYQRGLQWGEATALARKHGINKTTVSEIGRGVTYNV